MKMFRTLVIREWREWRNVMFVLGALYALLLVGSVVGMHRGASVIINDSSMQIEIGDDQDRDDQFEDFDDDFEDEWDWTGQWDDDFMASAETILFVYATSLRGTASAISFALVFLALFYFSDSVYKERADGSTFFHRSLPVPDYMVLLSKLFTGTVGALAISYLLALVSMAVARIAIPGVFVDAMAESDLSLSQIAYIDFLIDWLAYHAVMLLWLLPYAAYMLFVSTSTRSRPMMVGIGVPILLVVTERYFFQTSVIGEIITANLEHLTGAISWEWMGKSNYFLDVGESLELFDSFWGYIFSTRSFVSVIITGGFFFGTLKMYQKNVVPS